jgi:hypothetical protein
MPQLLSRMDDINWLTPSISEILDQGAAPPGGDGSIREQMLLLQKRLADLETPARIVNVRPTPSHTLFITRPDTVGRLGNRRPVTHNEIKRSLAQISEEHKEWRLGFLPQLQDAADSVGILLRTDEHKPLSLRRLLVRSAFREHTSTLAFAIGSTPEQKLVVRDLADIGNLMVIGSDNLKQHFVRALLLTFVTLNTPGELRLAIAGQAIDTYRVLIQSPHALGRLLEHPNDGRRLLEGLVMELGRRQQWFKDEGVENIQAYNILLKERGKTILPRILFVIDSISDPLWHQSASEWMEPLSELLSNQGKAGIHLVLTSGQLKPPDVPPALESLISLYVVMRTTGENYTDRINNFHNSLLRFVDAFVIDDRQDEIVPVEICAVTNEEAQRAITYWQQAAIQRNREAENKRISGKTGVTGMLTPPDVDQTQQVDAVGSDPAATTEQSQAPAEGHYEASLAQAQALAAYLGWLGVGPLQDILLMTPTKAQNTLRILRKQGVVEGGNTPTPRFVRLVGDPGHE